MELKIPTSGYTVEILEKLDSSTYLGKSEQFKIKFTSKKELKIGDVQFVPIRDIIEGTIDLKIKFLKTED